MACLGLPSRPVLIPRPPALPTPQSYLLVRELHKNPDGALGENAAADLVDDESLESLGVEPRGDAGSAPLFHQRVADVASYRPALSSSADMTLLKVSQAAGAKGHSPDQPSAYRPSLPF